MGDTQDKREYMNEIFSFDDHIFIPPLPIIVDELPSNTSFDFGIPIVKPQSNK